MPVSRPTLTELIGRVLGDIQSRLPGSNSLLRRSNVNVLGTVQAGTSHELYGYLDWVLKQVIPDTANAENLDRWTGIWGKVRFVAQPARGPVVFSGTGGTTIPAGLILARSDGAEFTTDTSLVLIGTTAAVAVTASTPGTAGNTLPGDTLVVTTPISGLLNAAVVDTAGLVGGTDDETDEDLLARLLTRLQYPPHGGMAVDYEVWLKELATVTRAWCFPGAGGAGTVGLTFVKDNDPVSIIPTPGDLVTAAAYLDSHIDPESGFIAGRPVTAKLFLYAPTRIYINPTIRIAPDNSDTRAAVVAELDALCLRLGGPGSTVTLNDIREAIGLAADVGGYALFVPTSDITTRQNEVLVTGVVTWR